MASPPHTVRLAEAVALVDEARTGIDAGETLGRLDAIADGCPGPTVDDVRRHLFETLGFRGDVEHYHHERNSLLSAVIDRRRGLPILLSVLTIDVGGRRGVTLEPIGMPGHFLVRHPGPPPVYLDPFDRGALVDRAACEALFRRSNGPARAFDPSLLEPVGPHEVIARVLTNLKGTYTAAGDLADLRWVLEMRTAVPGIPQVERLEHAAVLAELGRHDDAARVLDGLAEGAEGRLADAARHRGRALRARNN